MAPGKSGKKLSGGAIAGIVALVVLVALAIVALVVAPRIVAGRVEEAAKKRGLAIEYGGISLGFGSVTIESVKIKPAVGAAFVVDAPSVVAELSFLTPKKVRVPNATLKVEGSFSKVHEAVEALRKADQKVPQGERLPVAVDGGKLVWSGFVSGVGELRFDAVKLTTTPSAETIEAELDKGKLTVLLASAGPFKAKIVRRGKVLDATVSAAPKDGGTLEVAFHREDDGDDVHLVAEAFRIGAFVEGPLGIDLPKKSALDGDVVAKRTSDGAVSASGKLNAKGIGLPKVPVGPLSLSLGTSVGIDFKATPKKKAGDAKLEKGNVTLTIGGKPRIVKVTGDLSVGEDLDGPYAVDLAWELGPVACDDLAGDLVGGAIGGLGGLVAGSLAASAVSGNLTVVGTVKGDPTRPAKLVRTTTVKDPCKVDVALPKL